MPNSGLPSGVGQVSHSAGLNLFVVLLPTVWEAVDDVYCGFVFNVIINLR